MVCYVVLEEFHLSRIVRKLDFCLCENKGADQLRGNREADQRLCFRYRDSTFPPLLIPKFSRFWVSSVTVQAGLCWTWSETQIVGFLMHRLISYMYLSALREFGGKVLKDMSCVMRKPDFCLCEDKGADQLCNYLVFITGIVQFIFFFNLKFQVSSHCLYLLVCVRPGRKS